MQQRAELAGDDYINGNLSSCYKWIGNSATRLLYVYNYLAGYYGSHEARRFMDSIRNHRGI